MPNCIGFEACFSLTLVLMRPKLKRRFAEPSESRRDRGPFRLGTAPKTATQNIADKKRVRQEDVNSDYLLANFLQLPAFRSAPCPRDPSGSLRALQVEFESLSEIRLFIPLQRRAGLRSFRNFIPKHASARYRW